MKFFSLHNLTIAALVILLSSCGLVGKKSKAVENSALPEMELIAADGSKIQLSSFKGKKVFVNLWATWCPPCVAEMPSIQELYTKTNNSNTAFVMISFDKDFETAKNWLNQKGLVLPVYAANGELPDIFNVQGIPSTFIFDQDGQLVFKQTGADDYSKAKFVNMLSAF